MKHEIHSFPRTALPSVQHVTTSLDVGGAQAMLVKLVERGASGPLRHEIVSLLRAGAMAPACRRAECAVYSLDMKRGLPGPTAFVRLLRITGAIRPEVMQGWMYHGNLAASLAAFAQPRQLPVLWNIRHSLADISVESRMSRALIRLGARLSRSTAAVIYNSRASARQHEAVGFAPERTVHIPNGFDLTRFKLDRSRRVLLRERFGIAEQPLVVGLVARLHPMKDHAMMVEAVALARAAGHDLHLLMAGPGLDAPPACLARQIAALLPRERVTLVGERSDVAEWMPGLDMLGLSSAWGEAFPNVLGEAMACGVPCVATDVGDSAWVLGASGEIVPPRDAAALAAALGRLASISKEARWQIGDALRGRVAEQFEIGKVAQQYRRLYFAALEGRAMPGGSAELAAAKTGQAT